LYKAKFFWEVCLPGRSDLIRLIYRTTKSLDPDRPCIDTSGGFHTDMTDIFDIHDYEQDPEVFRARYGNLASDGTLDDWLGDRQQYPKGMPVFLSEYGGIRWNAGRDGWGYGHGPETEEEFLARLKGLTDALLENPCVFGYCYTQLTDVEQEQNGLYTYDRKPKFDPAVIRAILSAPAVIEDE